jgi:hypothetical protein
MEANTPQPNTEYQQVTVEVPEDRVAEFHAFFGRFLAGRVGRGRRGRYGRPHHGRHGHGHGHGRHGRHCGGRGEGREARESREQTEAGAQQPPQTTEI